MSRFANVKETKPAPLAARLSSEASNANKAPSRAGKRAMAGYFSPELTTAVKITAMRHDMSVQDAMGEALNDWLRKMGESPVGM